MTDSFKITLAAIIVGLLGVMLYLNFSNSQIKLSQASVKLYFANSLQDPEMLDCSKLSAVDRQITFSDSQGIYLATLEALLSGPTADELAKSYKTMINRAVVISSLSLQQGVATVDFPQTLQAGVAGSCRATAIRSQIESTLKQFPEIKTVRITIDGQEESILQP